MVRFRFQQIKATALYLTEYLGGKYLFMMPETSITIALDRAFAPIDDKAIRRLIAEWLVYDVKVQRNNSSAKIQLFHTDGAKPHLMRELGELYPGESLIAN